MSAYDITEFLRTAYRPFAYCVPFKPPLNTAYQKGRGVTLIYSGHVFKNSTPVAQCWRETECIHTLTVNYRQLV